ncbi:unnamed protein product, partial [Mesorhabditis spiculigera]
MLALKLLDTFPKLVNDFNVSEDYYGLSPLHQAIVNEDPYMVSILLRRGADVNKRCHGAFFCAEDQKSSRTDSLEHEYVELSTKTNYTGRMYFGEYPLHFAACMNQPECYRLLLAKKANPNAKDTNGNTVLHMCVIHENMETGEHLELLDGLLENILQAKWDAYAKVCWYRSLGFFVFYYVCFFMAYMNRPFSLTTEISTNGMINGDGQTYDLSRMVKDVDYNLTLVEVDDLTQFRYYEYSNLRYDDVKMRCHLMHYGELPIMQGYVRLGAEVLVLLQVILHLIMDIMDFRRIGRKKWWSVMAAFPAKLIFKATFLGVLLIIPLRLGCHLSEYFFILDNVISTIIVPMTTIHFLYYSRAVKFVGPFVLMIYTIIASDLSRFIVIYIIFLVGFSQSFYLIFTACERAAYTANVTVTQTTADDGDSFQNLIPNPQEALIRTFIMTIGEFMSLYRELAACDSLLMSTIGKVCFILFEMGVSILQFNLLIAMMTRTYEEIFQTSKEWKRQWAQ